MCDTLCVVGRDRSLFGKNSDRPRDEVQLCEVHPPRPAGGVLRTTYLEIEDTGACAVLGSRPEWMWGFEHGINEHRVAIGNERVFTVDDPHAAAPALTGMDLVRLALERAHDADEAIAILTGLLERHGQGGSCEEHEDDPYWSSFLVVDPRGAWILETSGRTWAARTVEDGASISNRISIGTDWTRASPDVAAGTDFDRWRDAAVPTIPSDDRLAATRACVATGAAGLTPRDVVATLRHHGDRPWGAPGDADDDVAALPTGIDADLHGFTVCFHVNVPGLIVQTTTASIVADLPIDPDRPTRAWVALGSPCASVYVPVFPPSGVPERLAEPETWHRFAALRDRVESEDGALATVRATLGPLETGLWEQADACADDEHRRASFVADAWGEVDAALTRLGV